MRPRVSAALRRSRPADWLRWAAHLPRYARLLLALARDRRVALGAKLLLVAAGAYALSPFDFDALPLLGQLDDLTVLLLLGRAFLALCPPAVVEEHAARIDPTGRWRPAGRP